MTLQALRNEVGDRAFFRVLRTWARTGDGNGTTAEFIALAEQVSGQQLDGLFDDVAVQHRPTGPDHGRGWDDRPLDRPSVVAADGCGEGTAGADGRAGRSAVAREFGAQACSRR